MEIEDTERIAIQLCNLDKKIDKANGFKVTQRERKREIFGTDTTLQFCRDIDSGRKGYRGAMIWDAHYDLRDLVRIRLCNFIGTKIAGGRGIEGLSIQLYDFVGTKKGRTCRILIDFLCIGMQLCNLER